MRLRLSTITELTHIQKFIEIDLTYEGIATVPCLVFIVITFLKIEIDLTYEGIATHASMQRLTIFFSHIEIDLTYEGIAT